MNDTNCTEENSAVQAKKVPVKKVSAKKAPIKKPAAKIKPVVKKKPAAIKVAPVVENSLDIQAPLLTAEQMMQVFKLSKKSTSIELKLSVPASGHRATIKKLRLDPVEAQPRQAFFFDTPNLDLFKAGVVVRARRIQGGRGDTVVKLRPVDPDKIDSELRRSEGFKIELDVMPGGFVCSASFKGVCSGKDVLDMTTGDMKLSELFSREQRAFYAAHAPKGIRLDSLKILGPVFLLKAKHEPKDFDRGVTVEMWLYPDGSRILEISTKCLPAEAFQIGTEFKAYLAGCGIPVSTFQEPKTRSALEFFAAELNPALVK